jgi:hypothetical protein
MHSPKRKKRPRKLRFKKSPNLGNDGIVGNSTQMKKRTKVFVEESSSPPKPSQKRATKVEKKYFPPQGRKVSLAKEKGKQLARKEEIPL